MSACIACLRRTALIAELAGHLDHLHAERGLLDEVFALEDEQLVAALVPQEDQRDGVFARAVAAMAGLDRAAPASGAADDQAPVPGSVLICRHDPAYPHALRQLSGPPAVLFLEGGERLASLIENPAVAIVGARRASAYGLEVARSLGRGLSAAGVTVVSGMAFGVDSAAHEGALETGARTIAVLGGGVDVPYPATKRALHAQLTERAVVVSELPFGFRPRRWTFPARNRLIAGLAAATVVVEAADRSGALITARAARELGRDVAAVPGQITSPVAAGPNLLLRDGAHLVDGPEAVLDLIFGVGARPSPVKAASDLAPGLMRVLEAVRCGEDTSAALTAGGLPPGEVLATLGELELRGLVRRAPGGGWVAVA